MRILPFLLTMTIVLTVTITMTMTAVALTAVPAAAQQDVVINEIAWMGSVQQEGESATKAAVREWIELANFGTEPIDLSNWVLEAADGTPTIQLSGTIAAGSYFLLERTNNDSVPGIIANQIYTGALLNSGETLELRNSRGFAEDSATWTSEGPGNNTTKQTMERTTSGDWQTSAEPGGTPKARNSSVQQEEPPQEETAPPPQEPIPTPEPEPAPPPPDQTNEPQPEPQQDYSAIPVLLSEFLPDPEGRDTEGEFIEIVNTGTATIDLSGWFLDDVDGNTTKPWKIPDGTTLAAGAYRAFFYAQTKVTLNNKDGDTVRLLDPTGRQHDAVRYNTSAEGWALARFGDIWEWTNKPTPDAPNKRGDRGQGTGNSDEETAAAPAATADAPAAPSTKTASTTTRKTSGAKTKSAGITQAPALPQGTAPSTLDENEQRDSQLLSASAQQSASPLRAQLPLIAAVALALLSGAGFVLFRIRE